MTVPLEVEVTQVHARAIGASHQVAAAAHSLIGNHRDPAWVQPVRRHVARHQAGSGQLLLGGWPEVDRPHRIAQAGEVHLGLPGHQGEHQAGRLAPNQLGHVSNALGDPGDVHAEELRHIRHRGGARRRQLLQFTLRLPLGLGEPRLRHFLVGGVATVGTEDQGVLAHIAEIHELVSHVASHHAHIAEHGGHRQPGSGRDPQVRPEVSPVGALEPGLVPVQGVAVLHQELPGANQAAAGPRLIAKLGLDLEHDPGQVPVGGDLRGGQIRHHLLMGHRQSHVPTAAVLEAHQRLVHLLPSPAALPELAGMYHRHGQLLASDRRDLFPQDPLDLLLGTQAQRQVAEDPRRQLLHVAPSQQKLVGDQLVRGCGAQGVAEELADPHGNKCTGAAGRGRALERITRGLWQPPSG